MTVSALAKMLGWPTSSTSRRLNGSQSLTIDDVVAIATVLCIPVSQLMPEVAA